MRFTVFTHAEHYRGKNKYYAYSPYIREMNIWCGIVDEVEILAPLKASKNDIDNSYDRKDLKFQPVNSIEFTSFRKSISSLFKIPGILVKLNRAMRETDHIHIRCPGNIGLLAAFIQVLFPDKPKSIKYAGNWDPESIQPFSYRLQKWILRNQYLTRNAKVLVYGDWVNQGNNILSFFTSSYPDSLKRYYKKDFSSPYRFVFAGTLSEGKRPLLAIRIIHELLKNGFKVKLDVYGEGAMRASILKYIKSNKLDKYIVLHGNQKSEVLVDAFKKAHFSILLSKSEGWPKVIAETMFFGCIPISTKVSCVPWMLGYGRMGLLVEPSVQNASKQIISLFNDTETMNQMSVDAQQWSQTYTLEKFEGEIKKLL